MTHDPVMLAAKIAKRIAAGDSVTYTTLEARAKELEVPDAIFQQAMTIVHRSKVIERMVKAGDIVYGVKVVKVAPTGAAWVTANYPRMDETNDGSGIEADYSYLFLTPEEIDKYKAALTGRTYVPKKRYANTRR